MSETIKAEGSCLCGAITFTTDNLIPKATACHCEMCRKWTGGVFISVSCGTDVKFEGDENLGVFDSSAWAERGFCKKCGASLFYRLKEQNSYFMPVSLFKDLKGVEFVTQVFIDKKPHFYSFAEDTKNLTEAEIFAMYGGSS